MKILLITYKFPPNVGGVSSSSYRIAKSYRKKGNEVFILDLGNEFGDIKLSFFDGFKVLRGGVKNFVKLFEFVVYKLKVKFDFIHSIYFYPSSFLGHLISKRLNIPHMASGRGNDVDKLMFDSEYFSTIISVLKECEVVTAVSTQMKNFLENILQREVLFIKNGFEPRIPIDKVKFRRRKKIFRVGFSGELRKKKGMENLLEALKILKDRNFKFKFLLVGDVRKKEKEAFLVFLKKFGLKDNIQITGFLKGENYVKSLLDINLYLHPSLRDGMPNGIIEAMYYKIPVVGTKVGGILDLLKDGRGIFVPYSDSEKLAAQIMKFAKNKEKYIPIIESAHNFVLTELTWQKEIDCFLNEIGKYI